ncbi:MAG: hypothetical protein MZW92_41760 [Comamonadaceae bacterium]|nr:hypothetical protein [Comamonadaceae bacterium]
MDFEYTNSRGETYHRRHAFEGVIPNMERRYRETESNLVRDELAKYLSESALSVLPGRAADPVRPPCVRRRPERAGDRRAAHRRGSRVVSRNSACRAGAAKSPSRSSRKSASG